MNDASQQKRNSAYLMKEKHYFLNIAVNTNTFVYVTALQFWTIFKVSVKSAGVLFFVPAVAHSNFCLSVCLSIDQCINYSSTASAFFGLFAPVASVFSSSQKSLKNV